MPEHRQCIIGYILIVLALAACKTSPAPSLPGIVTLSPNASVNATANIPATGTSTPAATARPSPTPTATLTPTSTPPPTPDPAQLLAKANAGLAQIQAVMGEADLICLRYEDMDADAAPEWLALVHQQADPARLSAFVLDGTATYWLEPAHPKPGIPDVGLGQYATCGLEIRDVNVDGVVEIAIFGHAQDNETLLHLFAWDGTSYRRLGRFSGDAGVRFVDADGDLEEEIWEGYRDRAAPSLAWHVIHTWENQTYGWTSDHYDWYSLDRPHSYPTHKAEYAVIAFYLALNDRDLPGAYALLVPQDGREYADWALGFATTARVSVGGVHPIPASVTETSTRVAAMVTSWDNEGGVIIGRLWNVEWDTLRTADGWRLVSASAEMLEEWPVTYWP